MPRRCSHKSGCRSTPLTGPNVIVSDEDLRAILNALPAMIGYWDCHLRNRMSNEVYVDYFGISPEALRGMHIRDLLGPELYEMNLPYMLGALAGEVQLFDRKIVDSSGRVRYTQASYIPDMVDGCARGFFVLVTDITERRRTEEALAATERRFRTLFDLAPLGTFLVSPDGIVLDVNSAAVELLRRSRESILGRSTHEFTHPDDVEASRAQMQDLVAGKVDRYTLETRYVCGDGGIVWAQLDARLLRGDDGTLSMLGQIQDISQRRRHEAELQKMARHDTLTGLLNRRGLLDELDRECGRMHRYGSGGALLVLDLDHFKAVNDAHGHEAGDEVLRAVGGILAARLRETDVVARHGGDEFAVILPHASLADAELLGGVLVAQIRAAHLGLPERPISVSAGVALLRGDDTSTEVLARADSAMYAAKTRGGDAVALTPAGGEASPCVVVSAARGAGGGQLAAAENSRGRESASTRHRR